MLRAPRLQGVLVPRSGPQLVELLTRAQRLAWRDLGARLADEDVTVEQWRALGALTGEPPTMSLLAERLQVPAPSLTRLVDGLVDRALVYRRAPAGDRRRIVVQLSDAGRAVLGRLDGLAEAHEAALLADLPADVRAALVTALEALVARAGDGAGVLR